MRGLKSLIVLAVVLVALGGYSYYLSKKAPESDTPKQDKVFASVQQDKIGEIRVKDAKGETTTLRKDAGAWQIVDPIAAKADDSEMASLTGALASMSVTRVIDEHPGDLKAFGLAQPRIEIAFKAEGDKDFRRLYVGDKTPTSADMYAKRDAEPRVFEIPAFQETTFNKSPFEFRDKTVMHFERDKVDGIEISSGGKTTAIAKKGGDWQLTKPADVRADFGTVEGLLGRIQTLQMKSIASADPTPADLKKYGLDKPSATVNLNTGSSRATLILGGKADDGTVYARDASKPAVITVENAFADELKKGPDDYRRKDIFEFRSFNANRIELTKGGVTVAFEKVKSTDDKNPEKWRRVSPTAGDVDREKMDSLLSRLSNMRASSFVDSTAKTGLDKPALTVFVKFDDGKKEERVTFGKNDNDAYAARPGEPGAAKIDATDLNEAIKSLDEISK